jgi:hypothetical protein
MKDTLLAQTVNIGGQIVTGPLVGINNIGDVINKLVQNLMFPLAGIILLIVLIWGGIEFMLSSGEPEKVKAARAKLTTGIIGFILLFVSYIIVRFIAYVFGLQTGIF